jgi:hypothetical protein
MNHFFASFNRLPGIIRTFHSFRSMRGGQQKKDMSIESCAEQFVAGERGVAPFATSFVRRGLHVTGRAT